MHFSLGLMNFTLSSLINESTLEINRQSNPNAGQCQQLACYPGTGHCKWVIRHTAEGNLGTGPQHQLAACLHSRMVGSLLNAGMHS